MAGDTRKAINKTIVDVCELIQKCIKDSSGKPRQTADDVKGLVQEVRDSVTLTDFESYTLREAAKSKSTLLTKDRYKEIDEKFTFVFGKHLRLIYSKLKRKFEVAKYSHIRRIDYHSALDFVNNFVLEDHI